MTEQPRRRGTVWGYEFVPGAPPKPVVVVSSDARNATTYGLVHVVRITSKPKPPLATIVELGEDDPVHGRAMCDEVEPIPKDELLDDPGSGAVLTPGTMERIEQALRLVFDLA